MVCALVHDAFIQQAEAGRVWNGAWVSWDFLYRICLGSVGVPLECPKSGSAMRSKQT
jgi:hypothetical protein